MASFLKLSSGHIRLWIVHCFLLLYAAPHSKAQGDPSRIPTGDELTGLIPQSNFKCWPGCASNCEDLEATFRSSLEEWCVAAFWVLDSTQCPTNVCILPGEPKALLSWVNNVCHLTAEAQNRWTNSTSEREDSSHRLPSCSNNCQGFADLYSSSMFSCPGTDIASCCDNSKPSVNNTKLCAGLVDMNECPDACTFGNDPRNLFAWVNITCAPESYDMEKWRDVTTAKEEAWLSEWIPALFPWNWTVQAFPQPATPSTLGIQITDPETSSTPYLSVPPLGPGTCASSTSEKLGVFAAVNVVSALLLPILGRRTVVNKLTFGIGGKLGSRGWSLMGVLSACLNVSANLVNARVIRSTPGYGDVPFGALALLWCTRPRLAWLAVFLATREAEDGMYFNSAASAITSEAILQVLGAVYFGITANYGRKNRFYYVKHLDAYPRGVDAHIMYAGALLWMVMLFITLGACFACIVGLNEVIGNARKMMSGIEKVAGAGANAIRSPLQAKEWMPKWIQDRINNRQQQVEAGPVVPPRKLTREEIRQIETVGAALIVFMSFLAQWLFWAGFMRAARERYGSYFWVWQAS